MILQCIAPAEETTQFSYQMVWALDREHCLLFMDAAINEIALRGGAVGDVLICDDDAGTRDSVMDKFAESHSIFDAVGDTDFKALAIILADPKTRSQLFIELTCDSDVCDVQILLFDKDGKIDTETDAEEYDPNMFLDTVEILTHVTYTAHHINDTEDDA